MLVHCILLFEIPIRRRIFSVCEGTRDEAAGKKPEVTFFVQRAGIEFISFDWIKYVKIRNLDFSFKDLLSLCKKAVNCTIWLFCCKK